MPFKTISEMREAHELWLSSGGREGERADLDNPFNNDLFENATDEDRRLRLECANLKQAILNRANLKDFNLINANFEGAELRRANFEAANLRRADLRNADLQNADLEKANYLLTAQLAGSDVAGAKLPNAIVDFKGLETIAEATSNAQKLFVAMLGGCLYSWLTIGTTKDAALLTNSASSPLPIIGTALPIVGFYLVAPIVLLGLYFYFHLNMQRLWEALADLPAVFPDGRTLDRRADPWLLNGLVVAHFVRLRGERPALSRIQQTLSLLLAWWVVPVTLLVFWGRFLPRHDWFGTSFHIGLLAAAIGFAWMSYGLARRTLRGAPRKPFLWKRAWRERQSLKRVGGFLGTCSVAIVFYFISFGAIQGVPSEAYSPSFQEYHLDSSVANLGPNNLRRLVPRLLEKVHCSPFANLSEEDVSLKPASWGGKKEEYQSVKGARLMNAQMQYAQARSAFLVNADLRKANLSYANLKSANLDGADLAQANLTEANLSSANVSNADLTRAELSTSKLSFADFKGATLVNVYLPLGDEIRGADFTDANLEGAFLMDANLSEAIGFTKPQISKAFTSDRTILPRNLPR